MKCEKPVEEKAKYNEAYRRTHKEPKADSVSGCDFIFMPVDKIEKVIVLFHSLF